ncbi:tetratricopeptide repeat protein [Anabaena cylindrica FACHB-243]|uniref:Serine/threonine protein kinase with TPR repeats n=1 Tax=Anabaena cylindrica (strain ATCC 27899 / PCC 7122) TaxID=272123 RepID=K9ZMH2_ANACC|nr:MULTISPECIES: serine/threonine-protein kinase [Anabaena]AFZ59994.1 serine/threonine protein kinase with TPR repeats [Anabaena cylindrica PCC 7122]MBD2417948.1 tetratricopeptide repeat protein [Anabaena cylindrica FACHB-243]MBY5285523.1 tetratricopeptide repeat protein [Anabaena sp. CCAP 1446/1C]MBY5307028.1 tetratricopeptide repeat protein [Anabaena sp. CCAP 1446/1C]MCM2404864.1 tetratricopeptide repeat protein [Anabaena sp. CCAP 1446/1C]
MLGNTLVGRYQIISHLGGGGFGETYVAYDTHLPGSPQCVVKKLKPQSTNAATLEIARRLFDTEAQVLYKLGTHDRIPQLLAYFEEDAEFYLVQEFIVSHDLSQELAPGKTLNQDQVVSLLQEILEILDFVHQQKVIHRDVNPRNILRREQDHKLILIDFGAVKEITTQVMIPAGKTKSTVAIGTPGYMPGEQAQGMPKLSSDIYALGIIAIQSITGLSPDQLEKDDDSNEIIWRNHATVTSEFADFLDKMICYDFRQRYASATVALNALQGLTKPSSGTLALSPAATGNNLKNIKPLKFKKVIFIKLTLGVLLLGLGGTASIYILNKVNTNNATELYKQGNTLLQLQKYEDALAVYEKAANIKPNYFQAWYGQGKALFKLQKYQESLLAYDKAIQLQPNYLEAWTDRGFVLSHLQRYSEAIFAFDKGLQIKEDYPALWDAKGDAFKNLKQYDNAIKSYNQAIELQPDNYEIWYKKGFLLQSLKQYDDAITAYIKAVELKPDYEAALYNWGNSLVNLNRYEDALKAYSQLVQYKPNHYQAWFSRGNSLITLRRYSEAIDSFKEVIKYNPSNYQAWYSLGWALHQSQRYAEAIESYNKAISLKSNDYKVWYNLGNSQYNLQKYADALAAYNKAVRYQKNHYESWYSRGNTLLNLKQYQEAIASYEQAIKYKPDYQQAIDAIKQAQTQLQPEKSRSIIVPILRLPDSNL